MKSPVNKLELKNIKKELKEIWNNKETNPNWRSDYGNLKNRQKELEEMVNGQEVRIWIRCKLFNCKVWTGRKGWGIPDLPHKFYFSESDGGVNVPKNVQADWVKFEEVEKCEKCAKLSDQEIAEIKKENKMWEAITDEITYYEIKNHSWAWK